MTDAPDVRADENEAQRGLNDTWPGDDAEFLRLFKKQLGRYDTVGDEQRLYEIAIRTCATIADLRQQIEALTAERDEARDGKEALSITVREWNQTYKGWRERALAAEAERDAVIDRAAKIAEEVMTEYSLSDAPNGYAVSKYIATSIRALATAKD